MTLATTSLLRTSAGARRPSPDRPIRPTTSAPDGTVDVAPGAPDHPADDWLLDGYDPAYSAAWPGAAPRGWDGAPRGVRRRTPDPAQLGFTFGASLDDALDALDAGEHAPFRRAGFAVRRLAGRGIRRVIDALRERHHYLPSLAMNGRRNYGLYAPDGSAAGELVGIAVLADPTQRKTAAGMQVGAVPEDAALTAAERRHVRYGADECLDVVRFCIADATEAGVRLGTGAESYFYAAIVRDALAGNRARWRAERWAERLAERARGGAPVPPLPAWAAALLTAGVPYLRCLRSLADADAGHTGGIYVSAGAFAIGHTRAETTYVGRRSGHPGNRRSLAKLGRARTGGATHQALRAVWEGGSGTATARTAAGHVLGVFDLAWVREAVADGLGPAARQSALCAAWAAERTRREGDVGAVGPVRWTLEADLAGYAPKRTTPKARFCHFLAARPGIHLGLARRCRYLRVGVLAAEAAWYAAERRFPRGIGYNWPRRPQRLGWPAALTA